MRSPLLSTSSDLTSPSYQNPALPVPDRVADLMARLTLEEMIGQMTQVERNSISPAEVAQFFVGSVLSGGGGYPPDNTPLGWLKMIGEYQQAARQTRLGIPILYGVDAVHGHNNLYGAVIFPHNIGLGAARSPDLAYRIGRATAEEAAATGVHWNFFPTVAVPQDIRWGRTYEAYSEDAGLVSTLGAAYIRGLQGDGLRAPAAVLATPKHFVGDGATTWGSTGVGPYAGDAWPHAGPPPAQDFKIDAGDVQVDEATLREVHLAPYVAALAAGAQIVMASFSSWRGVKMHGSRYWLTDVLKGELGFRGFVVTDWGGLARVASDYYQSVVTGINAGIDLNMVPQDFRRFVSTVKQAVENGDIALERIADAARRILAVKFRFGLFDRPFADPASLPPVGSAEHRQLAAEAVARSLVLLKNEGRALPFAKSLPLILVAGEGAHDIGLQCGGWTVEWLGGRGPITPGTTLLEAVRAAVSPATRVEYDPAGCFPQLTGGSRSPVTAEAGIVVVAEPPYAEGFGDRADLNLPAADCEVIERMRPRCKQLAVILLSGRPLIVTEQLPLMDALVAAWLPGSEGQGVAAALFGDAPFTGKLPFAWPRTMEQIPWPAPGAGAEAAGPLFPFGHGLA
jgi:beta-glucosidase